MDKEDLKAGYLFTIFFGIILIIMGIFAWNDVYHSKDIMKFKLIKIGLISFGGLLIYIAIILSIISNMFERTNKKIKDTENLIIKCTCGEYINFNKNKININIECPECHTLYLKDFSGEIKVTPALKEENSDKEKLIKKN